jgi:plastocyanin
MNGESNSAGALPRDEKTRGGRRIRVTRRFGLPLVASVGLAGILLAACSSSTPSATPTTAASRGSTAATAAPSGPASSGSTQASPTSSGAASSAPASNVSLIVQTGKMDGRPGWPRFVPANFSVTAGQKVVLTITSYDDGTAPLPAGMTTYDSVQGGTETVNGQPVSSIPNADVSHTFTVPALGVNVPIPAVASGQKTVTVVFTFTPTKSGTFTWECMAPCGTGADGMGGPMATPGWMRGTLTVA